MCRGCRSAVVVIHIGELSLAELPISRVEASVWRCCESAGASSSIRRTSSGIPTPAGAVEARARALAIQIAGNAPLTNQLILTALPRISDMSRNDGFWAEALTTAVSQSTADADEGLRDFLEKRPPDFRGK
jgi:(methylthio)acryloyl-CoA hydratase